MARKNIFNNEEEELSEYEMMGEDIVEETDEVEDDDGMQEILDEYEEKPVVKKSHLNHPNKKEISSPAKKAGYSLNPKESDIMNSAMVQLEQAKLYDMFLKHNLFEGVKANPVALKRVEAELKGFILERMQILLGMKEERKTQQIQQVKVELPFNEVEVDFLRQLAFKGTKGESAKANLKAVEAKTVSSMKTIEDEQPRLKSLAKIQQEEPEEIEEEEFEEEIPEPPRRVMKKPIKQAPVPRRPVRKTPSSIEEIAREDLKKMAKRKPAHLMTPEELMEHNKKISSGKAERPANALPIPSEDQMVSHYMAQQMRNSTNPNANNVLMNMLSNKLGFSTNTVQQMGDDYED